RLTCRRRRCGGDAVGRCAVDGRTRSHGQRRQALGGRSGQRLLGGGIREDHCVRARQGPRVRPRRDRRRPSRDRHVDTRSDRARRRAGDVGDLLRRRHRVGTGRAAMTERIRVFVVDDHALFRSGVRAEIGDAVDIVGDVGPVDEAIVAIRATSPDVVLLDVHLPNGGGKAILEGLAEDRGYTKCLALSFSDAADDVIGVIRAGARGYVTKTITREELLDAIRRVRAGDAVFSPRLAGFVLDAFAGSAPVASDPDLDRLTHREQEVLRLIARGYTYKEV